jgi:hypothetical protein
MAKPWRVLIVAAGLVALPLLGSLFVSEQSQLHVAAGEPPLCRKGVSLGRAVLGARSTCAARPSSTTRTSGSRAAAQFALRGEAALERDAFDALERLLGAELMSDDARLVR